LLDSAADAAVPSRMWRPGAPVRDENPERGSPDPSPGRWYCPQRHARAAGPAKAASGVAGS